jgi:hypothetical protein
MQVCDRQLHRQRLAATLQLQLDSVTNCAIQQLLNLAMSKVGGQHRASAEVAWLNTLG